jgi:L-idonate 5-dehydrogenase
MLACVIHKEHDLRIDELETLGANLLEPNEVRIRFGAGGICGSDLHYYQHGGVGDFRLREPMVLGHEVAGEVVEIGKDVTRVKPGDHVAVDPSRPCQRCEDCLAGRSNLCANMRFFGSAARFPHVQGAFVEFFKVADFQCHVVESDVPFHLAACAEPLSVALHAVARAGALVGARVLITGSGPIGALIVAAAKLAGASQITVTDLVDEPLEVSRKLGATEVINVASQADRLAELESGRGVFDISIEASGNARGLEACILATRPGGRVVQVGLMPPGLSPAPINRIITKELEFVGTFRFHREFAWAVDAIGSGRINLDPLLTAQFGFQDAVNAFKLAGDRRRAMKVSLRLG